jgi:hypothetical protein
MTKTKEDIIKLREAVASHLEFRKSLGVYNAEAESIINLLDAQLKIIDHLLSPPEKK